MAELTTTPEEFIAGIAEPRRSQIQALFDMVREAAPELEPWMVAGKIGFGKFHYKGKSKACEGEWFKVAIGNNKNTIMFASCAAPGNGRTLAESYAEKLPNAQFGQTCINFRKFEDIDLEVLREIVLRTASSDFGNWVQ
jgi:hypothetical protein